MKVLFNNSTRSFFGNAIIAFSFLLSNAGILWSQTTSILQSNTDVIETKGELELYPNPGNGQFQINQATLSESEQIVEVYSTMGKLLVSKKINDQDRSVDITHLPNGIYLIKLDREVTNFVKH